MGGWGALALIRGNAQHWPNSLTEVPTEDTPPSIVPCIKQKVPRVLVLLSVPSVLEHGRTGKGVSYVGFVLGGVVLERGRAGEGAVFAYGGAVVARGGGADGAILLQVFLQAGQRLVQVLQVILNIHIQNVTGS